MRTTVVEATDKNVTTVGAKDGKKSSRKRTYMRRASTLTEAVLEPAGDVLHVAHAARTLVLATSSLKTPVVCPTGMEMSRTR
jgi:hypothetical protein